MEGQGMGLLVVGAVALVGLAGVVLASQGGATGALSCAIGEEKVLLGLEDGQSTWACRPRYAMQKYRPPGEQHYQSRPYGKPWERYHFSRQRENPRLRKG